MDKKIIKIINGYRLFLDTPFFNISIIDKFIKKFEKNDSLLYFVKSEEKDIIFLVYGH